MSDTDVEAVEPAAIGDVLNDSKPVETPVEEPKGEPVEAEATTETEEPPSPEDVKTAAFLSKALDERDKRQALAAENADLRKQLETQEVERPDMLEDPEGFARFQDDRTDQKILQARLEISESMVRGAHPDYDEMVTAYEEAAKINPFLDQQALQHPNPHQFVYETGAQWQQSKEISSPDFEAKIRADERAKIEAEGKPGASIPESLAGESSVSGRNVEPGAASLQSVFGS